MTALTPADILDAAADVIVRNGWTQDQFYLPLGIDGQPFAYLRGVPWKDSRECPVCAGAGINVAADCSPDLDDDPTGAHADAVEAFAVRVSPGYDPEAEDYDGRPYATIGNWNDAPNRTAEQVVAELRACAADLRREAS